MTMRKQVLMDPGADPPLGESRSRVLDLLRERQNAVSVQEIATDTGLHANTARFHLDGLVEAGLATRSSEDSGKPGRPRTVYRQVNEPTGGGRSYRLLAEMLTSMAAAAGGNPRDTANAAGRDWGRYLVERPAPTEQVDASDALRRLERVLSDTGFAPEMLADGQDPRIGLRHCPFKEIAEQHPEVVCSLHLGLMQGALDEVRSPLAAERLEPFVEPSLCVAHLSTGRSSHRGSDSDAKRAKKPRD